VRRTLEISRVVLLAAGLVTVPILNATASANHDHPFDSHIFHAAESEDGHHTEGDSHSDLDHHESVDLQDDGDTSRSTANEICCEDIGLCSVGLVLPQVERMSQFPPISKHDHPGNAVPWLNHLSRPDGPPPRSQS